MVSSITQIANIKDIYTGTVFADSVTYGQVTFNSFFLSSTVSGILGTSGHSYILSYHINGQICTSNTYVAAFSCIQDYRLRFDVSQFNTITFSDTPRNSTYSNTVITDVKAGPINTYSPPFVKFTTNNSATWAYTIWVDGFISKVLF